MSELSDQAPPTDDMDVVAKRLDIRLKELEIANKEYEAIHRPTVFRSAMASPAVIAAAIAAWASLTAAGLTWLSGTISARTQAEASKQQSALEEKRFEGNLIIEAVRTDDPDKAAGNLAFLLRAGLLTGDTAAGIERYLVSRRRGEGQALPLPK